MNYVELTISSATPGVELVIGARIDGELVELAARDPPARVRVEEVDLE